jgi:hypothetical protein
MLVPSKRLARNYEHTTQVCTSDKGDEVFCAHNTDEDCPPACHTKNVLQLLTRDDWNSVVKKYRLSNAAIRKLRLFWSLGETEFNTDSARLQWAFTDLEQTMLNRMKRIVRAKRGVKFLPWHDATPNNHSVSNHMIMGNTASGKTTMACKLLCRENSNGECWSKNRDVVCFSMHPEDPSLAPARKKIGKKRWHDVSFSKIDGQLDISMLPKGCLCIFDDCLEMQGDFRCKVLHGLINQVMTTGRHWKSKNGRGTEAICITHRGSSRNLQTARLASRFWTLFPQGSKQQMVHILKSRLALTKRQISTMLENCKNSRYCTFDLHHPQKMISERHVQLLD